MLSGSNVTCVYMTMALGQTDGLGPFYPLGLAELSLVDAPDCEMKIKNRLLLSACHAVVIGDHRTEGVSPLESPYLTSSFARSKSAV